MIYGDGVEVETAFYRDAVREIPSNMGSVLGLMRTFVPEIPWGGSLL